MPRFVGYIGVYSLEIVKAGEKFTRQLCRSSGTPMAPGKSTTANSHVEGKERSNGKLKDLHYSSCLEGT
jgi:hypothetical protein